MDTEELAKRQIEENKFAREIHFKNEAFYIGILHAVAGGSLVASLHELNSLLLIASPGAVLSFFTLIVFALAAAVVAAALKHSYKMYDMKAQAGEPTKNLALANSRLAWMRRFMTISVTVLLIAYGVLLAAGWFRFLTDPGMFDEDMDSEGFRTSEDFGRIAFEFSRGNSSVGRAQPCQG